MKYRNGFVSNSSSSSFLINLKDITPIQKYLIERHFDASKIFEGEFQYCISDQWQIEVGSYTIRGSTVMTNFDMEEWLKRIGVDMKHVQFEGS